MRSSLRALRDRDRRLRAQLQRGGDQTREDLTKAELIAFPLLAIMLLVVFRGVIAAAIPLVIGVVSILGTLFALRIMAELVDTSLFALNIATALSLGLAVDYALLMVSRYREELEHDGATQEAHRRTVATAGKTVLFSGLTVAAAMIALIVFPQRFLYSVAVAGATVAILASVVTLLAVPALLALLGERINSLSIRSGPAVSDSSDGWYRLAWAVMRRPVIVAVATTAFLLAAAAPLLSTILTGPSAEAVPPGKPSYVVNEYVADHYDRSLGEGITVAVDGKASDKNLDALRDRIRAIDGIGGGSEFDRATPQLAYATFAPQGQGAPSAHAGRREGDPRARPRRGRGARLGQHGPLHRPEAEPDRAHAGSWSRSSARRRSSSSSC